MSGRVGDEQTPDIEAQAGEVWQEADNVLLLCVIPGVEWRDFNGARVPWDAPLIARPLRRLLDAEGNLVAPVLAAAVREARAAELREAADDLDVRLLVEVFDPLAIRDWLRDRADRIAVDAPEGGEGR